MVYQQSLDRTFAALADSTRREILARLATGERSISELASNFDMTLVAVSKHVYVLERAGLAAVRRDGRSRRTRLVAAPMREAREWIDVYKLFWVHQLDQLAAYLEGPSPEESSTCPPTPPPRTKTSRHSKSAASSARRANASSRRGRRPRK